MRVQQYMALLDGVMQEILNWSMGAEENVVPGVASAPSAAVAVGGGGKGMGAGGKGMGGGTFMGGVCGEGMVGRYVCEYGGGMGSVWSAYAAMYGGGAHANGLYEVG